MKKSYILLKVDLVLFARYASIDRGSTKNVTAAPKGAP